MEAFEDIDPEWDAEDPFDDAGEGGGDGNDDDDGNAESSGGGMFGAEHTLLLFDCDASMFDSYVPCLPEEDDGGDADMEEKLVSPMEVAVAAANQFLRTKIRDIAETKSGKRDGIGVLLYGCDPNRAMRAKSPKSSNSGSSGSDSDEREELPTTHELIELAPPGIEQVLAIQECLAPAEGTNRRRRDLGKEFSTLKGDSGDDGDEGGDEDEDRACTLLQGLTAAMKVFSNAKCVKKPTPSSKSLPDSKTMWIFTNNDDPCRGDENAKSRIDVVKRDCREDDIAIHVLPLPKNPPSKSGNEDMGNDAFDQDIFYNDLTAAHNRVDEEDVKDAESGAVDVEALVERFQFGTKKRRKLASVPLLLPGWRERKDDPGIMLDLYGAVQVRSRPQMFKVHQEKNTILTTRTIKVNKETKEEVQPEDIHHFADLRGRVPLPPANIATAKRLSNSLDKAGLVVHGFRPLKFLPTTNLMHRNLLAFANDARVQGSAKALYNLKQSMRKKKVFAVGEILLRASSTSKMVALVPRDDESGDLYVVHLPYREDVREVPREDIGFADRAAVDAAKAMILRSQLHTEDFVASLPDNPYLLHFFGFLESVSLGRPLAEIEDDTRMDVEQMLKNASDEIESFSLSLPEDDVPAKKDRKRKAPSSTKTEFVKEPISEEWIDMYKNDEIADQKNDVLKAFLKNQGERQAGKKSDLIDRVERCIQKELFKK